MMRCFGDQCASFGRRTIVITASFSSLQRAVVENRPSLATCLTLSVCTNEDLFALAPWVVRVGGAMHGATWGAWGLCGPLETCGVSLNGLSREVKLHPVRTEPTGCMIERSPRSASTSLPPTPTPHEGRRTKLQKTPANATHSPPTPERFACQETGGPNL